MDKSKTLNPRSIPLKPEINTGMSVDGLEVLVTGADQRQGLAVIRSLGKYGVKVLAAGIKENSFGFYSRYAAATWVYPSPFDDPQGFVDSILDAVRRYGIRLVFPVVESTLVVINQFRSTLEQEVEIVAASREAVDLAMDKDRQFTIATELGIRVPKTATPESMQTALAEVKEFNFPLVLKASVKPQDTELSSDVLKVRYARDQRSLEKLLEEYYRSGVIPVIQELVFGEGLGCGVLMDHEKPLCCYQYWRGRENHPTGGVPVRYTSMPMWSEVREQSVRLLQAMGWHGIAQVEWKNIIGTREVVLMEVNGRFWASLPGALHAGMDFPVWLYDLWKGKEIQCSENYSVPVTSRYLSGDANRLDLLLDLEEPISSVPLGSKRREILDFIFDFFRFGVKSDIFSWRDPKPGIMEIRLVMKRYLKRLLRKMLFKKVSL